MRPFATFGTRPLSRVPSIPAAANRARPGLTELHSGNTAVESNILPLNKLIDRVERLENLFESELHAVVDACHGFVQSRGGRGDHDIESIQNSIQQMERQVQDLNRQIQQHALTTPVPSCVTEADWISLQERLDERFNAQVERASEHHVGIERTFKMWQEKTNARFSALEKQVSQLYSKEARLSDQNQSLHMLNDVLQGFSQKLVALEERYEKLDGQGLSLRTGHVQTANEIEVFQQQMRSQFQVLGSSAQSSVSSQFASFKKEFQDELNLIRQAVEDSRTRDFEFESRLNTSTELASDLARQSFNGMVSDIRTDFSASIETLRKNMERKFDHIAKETPASISALAKRLNECEIKAGSATPLGKRLSEFESSNETLKKSLEQANLDLGKHLEHVAKQSVANAAALEKRLKELEMSEKGLLDSCQTRLERRVAELQTELTHDIEASKQSILELAATDLHRSAASIKKDADHHAKEIRSFCASSAKQMELHVEERLAGERSRMTQHVDEETRVVSERLGNQINGFAEQLEAVSKTLQPQLERLASNACTEMHSKLEALEGKLNSSIQELQHDAGNMKKQVDRTVQDQQESHTVMSRQIKSVVDESRNISGRIGALAQVGRDANAAAASVERQLQNFEVRYDAALEGHEQQLMRSVNDLRADIASSTDSSKRQFELAAEENKAGTCGLFKQIERNIAEIRTETGATTEAIRKQIDRTVEEWHSAQLSTNKQIESIIADMGASEEKNRATARLAEGASKGLQHAESRAANLEERVNASAESRCRLAERVAREASADAKAYADTLSKRSTQNMEELQGTINAVAKHARTAVEDTRAIDERASAASKNAQEALQQVADLAMRKPEVNVNEVSRQQLDRTAADIRLETKNGLQTLGRELESTLEDLRGQVNSLSLQMECGLSGSSTILGDVVESAAQKHVEHLEWLKALDGHRSQVEKQQAEVEERLSKMLRCHKDASQADLDAMKLKVEQRLHADVQEVKSDLARVGMDCKNLTARVVEWETLSKSMGDQVNSLQFTVTQNRSNLVDIVDAIRTTTKPDPESAYDQ